MTDYEKASLLYLAQIAGLLHALASTEPHIAGRIDALAGELRRDLRKHCGEEVRVVLGDLKL